MKAELLLDARATLGEGSIWDPRLNLLWWVDIMEKKLFAYIPDTGENRTYGMPSEIGTVVPRSGPGLAVALRDGFYFYEPETGLLDQVADPEPEISSNRFNDGKCDPAGRFWAGTMGAGPEAARNAGSLYCLFPDGSVKKWVDGIACSNGICWSLDHTTMYYIDTPTQRVDAFDYDHDTGEVSNRRPVIEIDPETGHPDGMTMDAEGNLWIAHWAGFRVSCWNPQTGTQVAEVSVPAARVTSCAFGGPNLETLFITTAGVGLSDEEKKEQPHAGGLFHLKPGVSGIPACCFAG